MAVFRKTGVFSAIAVVVFAIFIAGCGSGEKTGDGKRFLSIGTAPPGGAFFVVGGAIAQVLDQHLADRNWSVSAEATKGTQENIRRLAAGELDVAMANAAISYFAVRGEGWDKAYPIRTIATLAPNIALFITPADNGVKVLQDLKGERVVVGPAGAGFEFFLKPILEEHGVAYDDFTPLNNTQAGAVDMLADGSAAAAFLGGAVPTASITQACAGQDIFFIPFEESARERLIEKYPFFHAARIPAGTYRGQEAEYQGLNVGSMHLITRADLDEETVYQLTKALYENREEVVKQHPAGKAINPQNAIRDTGTPFHPGAIRFYKEIGIWPAENSGADSE